jgi:hypothetical protein
MYSYYMSTRCIILCISKSINQIAHQEACRPTSIPCLVHATFRHGWTRGPRPSPLRPSTASLLGAGYPGKSPTDLANTPWFLEDPSTRKLMDRKRHRSSAPPASSSNPLARGKLPSTDRRLSFELPHSHKGTRTRMVLAGVSTAPAVASDGLTMPGATPVPQEPPRKVRDFATPREQRDFLTPLPFVPAGQSLRRAFIKHFGGLRGMDPASFDEVRKVAKNGYNQAHDAHFLRFRTDFLTHSPLPRFNAAPHPSSHTSTSRKLGRSLSLFQMYKGLSNIRLFT